MTSTDLSNAIAHQLPLMNDRGVCASLRRELKVQMVKVNDMFAQVRQLHDQINTYLHQCPASERPAISSPANAANLLEPFYSEAWTMKSSGSFC